MKANTLYKYYYNALYISKTPKFGGLRGSTWYKYFKLTKNF